MVRDFRRHQFECVQILATMMKVHRIDGDSVNYHGRTSLPGHLSRHRWYQSETPDRVSGEPHVREVIGVGDEVSDIPAETWQTSQECHRARGEEDCILITRNHAIT